MVIDQPAALRNNNRSEAQLAVLLLQPHYVTCIKHMRRTVKRQASCASERKSFRSAAGCSLTATECVTCVKRTHRVCVSNSPAALRNENRSEAQLVVLPLQPHNVTCISAKTIIVCMHRVFDQPAALRNKNRSEAQLVDTHDVIIGLDIEIRGRCMARSA